MCKKNIYISRCEFISSCFFSAKCVPGLTVSSRLDTYRRTNAHNEPRGGVSCRSGSLSNLLKNPLSQAEDNTMSTNKCSRVGVLHQRNSSVGRCMTHLVHEPILKFPSTRNLRATSHSLEMRDSYPASSLLRAVFPPHRRSIGAVELSSSGGGWTACAR
ncbi:hypothetical protein C8R45DRAFT_190099 [Mycena sanguinolenta]|nr:hypothetical protein C8R45DRAFT_190099 [Mycena sanguinolenta]